MIINSTRHPVAVRGDITNPKPGPEPEPEPEPQPSARVVQNPEAFLLIGTHTDDIVPRGVSRRTSIMGKKLIVYIQPRSISVLAVLTRSVVSRFRENTRYLGFWSQPKSASAFDVCLMITLTDCQHPRLKSRKFMSCFSLLESLHLILLHQTLKSQGYKLLFCDIRKTDSFDKYVTLWNSVINFTNFEYPHVIGLKIRPKIIARR